MTYRSWKKNSASRRGQPEHRNYLDQPVVDPFPTDIYYLGNMLREDFVKKYYGFEFIKPLVADMVQEDPSLQHTISVVVSRSTEISAALTTWRLRSRLVGRKYSSILCPFRLIRTGSGIPASLIRITYRSSSVSGLPTFCR
ncbi:hypothetical protein FA95DRAFT_1562034 [Auriscalpium vulgare]|uniref:Uncharacterized protein n=1 Tax=Auriscalpium vulgare TaxID=40419 RepID=A0ACB8RK12_9AGAM|nr:hypothetical protein FA95DRAFT_1562034 [Auriscalpium vulgare]